MLMLSYSVSPEKAAPQLAAATVMCDRRLHPAHCMSSSREPCAQDLAAGVKLYCRDRTSARPPSQASSRVACPVESTAAQKSGWLRATCTPCSRQGKDGHA